MKDYVDPIFTREELKHVANKWQYWKGFAVGGMITLGVLVVIGLMYGN